MTDCYAFHEGTVPLVISVPHDGRTLPPGVAARMTEKGLAIPDTDWHVNRLYGFAEELGASVISANYSRYVVDLNRSSDDEVLYENQRVTGLCPSQTFAGEDIYLSGAGVTEKERQTRIHEYWQPYHDKLRATVQKLRAEHGHVLLWDAHSIPAEVPLLFDGRLPDLNIGTNSGASCDAAVEQAANSTAQDSPYTTVLNGRFRGGFITRHYGAPADRIHAVQLELAQSAYMNEKTLRYDAGPAKLLAGSIKEMLHACLVSAARTGQSNQ